MSGLEAVEITLSEVIKDNDRFRIDSEYFKKEYLEFSSVLKKISKPLSVFLKSGIYGILPKSEDYVENGLPLLRGVDLRNDLLDIANLVKVPSFYYSEKYSVKKGDIFILVKGATIDYYDGVLLVDNNVEKMIFNGSCFRIRLNDEINKYFVFVFMQTKYFTYQKKLAVVNNGIEYNSLDSIHNYKIPLFPLDFQQEIEKIVKDVHKKLEESKSLYSYASDLLLQELGLKDFNPSNENISIKTLKESFLKTGRLDSEYYQVKYESLLSKLNIYGSSKLFNFVESYTIGFPYSSDTYVKKEGIPLIKIGNINAITLDLSNVTLIPKSDLHLSEENIIQKNDILISMSGTIGSSCIIDDNIEAVVNQRIMKIKSKNINPYVFTVIVNSVIGKLQLERVGTGGVQTNISANDILNIDIPLISEPIQSEIASYIKKSIAYSKEAKELLKATISKLEKTIENSVGGGYDIKQLN